MLTLLLIIGTLAVFSVLIVIAGIKGFFKGAAEEVERQHGVLRGMFAKLKNRRFKGGKPTSPEN